MTKECGFCNGPDGRHYIFPLPKKYRHELNHGLKACGKCLPDVRQAQYDEGILLHPLPAPFNMNWNTEE